MSHPKKPHEVWDKLQRDALAEEGQRVSQLSDTDLDEELRKAGLDPAAIRARGAKLGERARAAAKSHGLGSAAKPESREPEGSDQGWAVAQAAPLRGHPIRERWALLAAAAIAATLVGGAVYVAAHIGRRERPIETKPDAAPTRPERSAAESSPPLEPSPPINDKPRVPRKPH